MWPGRTLAIILAAAIVGAVLGGVGYVIVRGLADHLP